MNKGDKVRIKDWNDGKWEGFEAEVIEVDECNGPCLKPLSDRPDGLKRHEFHWPESKLELISEEKSFEVGDRVKILASQTQFLSDTIGRLGTVLAVDGPSSFRVDVDNYEYRQSGSIWYYNKKELELVTEEKPTIEVGDTVKATHAESGSVVRGVVIYAYFTGIDSGDDNLEIAISPDEVGTLDLYAYQGWEFELVAKKEVPKVGDGFTPGLPVGTALEANTSGLRVFRTTKGWTDHDGFVLEDDTDWNPDVWKIAYLPPTDSE